MHPKRICAIFHLDGLRSLEINARKTRMGWIICRSRPAVYRSRSRRGHNREYLEHESIQLGWEQLEIVS